VPFYVVAPTVTEYRQWTGSNLTEIVEFCDSGIQFYDNEDGSLLVNGWMNLPQYSMISHYGYVIRPVDAGTYQEVSTGDRREYVLDLVEES